MFFQALFIAYFVTRYFSLALNLEALILREENKATMYPKFYFFASIASEFVFCCVAIGLLWKSAADFGTHRVVIS
jgi:hypothetical protein